METYTIIRVRFQKIYLFLKLVRVNPVIIAFAKGDVFTADFGEYELLKYATYSLRIQILLVEDRKYLVRVFFSVFTYYFCGAIR